jgi:Domain of unknown function (DUF4412)
METRKIASFHMQCALLVLAAAVAHAGFRFTDENGTQSLVSEGRFKQVYGSAPQSQSMIDMNSGQMWMSNAERKVYWQGTVDEFCGQMKHAVSAMQDAIRKGMEEQMTKMPPGQRAKMAEAMKHFGALGGLEQKPEAASEPEVTVERTNDTATIAGQPTLKYRVLSDGEVQGEYWITTDAAIAREFALDRAATTMGRFQSCRSASRSRGGGGELTEEVFSKGFPLKTRTYVDGKPVASRVYTKVEKVEIPDVEFSPPAGFRRVTIRETMLPAIQPAPNSGGRGE